MNSDTRNVGFAIFVVVALIVGCVLLGEHFAIGWLTFPFTVLPRITVDWPSVIAGTLAFVLFAFGLHQTGRWCVSWLPDNLIAARIWRLRQTGLVLIAVTLLFSMGTALVGAVHQVIWLSSNRSAPSLDSAMEPPPGGVVENARAEARKGNLRVRMKMLGLGAHNFHDVMSHFPAGGTMNAEGELLHGWMMPLGPYLGFYSEELDYRLPWNKPPNDRLYRCQIHDFLNPMQPGPIFDRDGFGLTHYAANAHVFPIRLSTPDMSKHRPFPSAPGIKVTDIKDGASNTFLIGTVGRNHKPWGYPANVRDPGEGLNRTPTSFGGVPGERSAYFVMADGSVREINDKMDPKILKALATPNGHEDVDLDAFRK